MPTDLLAEEVRRWRIEHGYPAEKPTDSLQQQADAILSRPGVVTPFGLRNISREDALIVSQAYPRVVEQQGRPGQALSGFEAYDNIVKGIAETITEPFSAQLRRSREAVGPFKAWEQFEAPSFKTPGLPKVTGAIGQTIGEALAGRSGEEATLGRVGRQVAEALTPSSFGVKGAIELTADPANLLPVVGFGKEIGAGARAVSRGVTRGAEEALVRAPGDVLPELGLKLAGKPSVAGAADIPKAAIDSAVRDFRRVASESGMTSDATNKAVRVIRSQDLLGVEELTDVSKEADTWLSRYFKAVEERLAQPPAPTKPVAPVTGGARLSEPPKPSGTIRLYRGEPEGTRPVFNAMTGNEIPFSSTREGAEGFVPRGGRIVYIDVTPGQLKSLNKLAEETYTVPQSLYETAQQLTEPVAPVTKPRVPARGPVVPSRQAEVAGDLPFTEAVGRRLGVPEDIRADIALLREERQWRKALTTVGTEVKVSGTNRNGFIVSTVPDSLLTSDPESRIFVRMRDSNKIETFRPTQLGLLDEGAGAIQKAALPDRATPPTGMATLSDAQILRGFREATTKSAEFGEKRAALPPGTSRARVTTANARWATYAESRDRYIQEWMRRYPDRPIEEAAVGRVAARPPVPVAVAEESVSAPRGRTLRTRRTPPPRIPPGETAAGVVPPSPAAAPPSPPGRPPTATGGGVTPAGPDIPSYVEPPMMGKNVLGMKPIQAGLSKTEEIDNIARRLVSKVRIRTVEANPLTSAAFKERARVKSVVDAQSGRLGTVNSARLNRVFQVDKTGRIPSLAGIDSTIPGAPTIQDVAARLPTYWGRLSTAQRDALLAVRDNITPYHSLLDEVGVEVHSRADVMDGGFYLPRGRADLEGADLPLKVGSGLGRGTKKGFERPAVFDSQAAGIEAGYQYSPIGDTLTAYARDAGNRSIDAHVTNFFKSAVDETGLPLGQTPKMRLMEQSPELAQQMESLKVSLGKLKAYTDNLSKRQLEVIDRWSADPSFDDLDVLLEGLGTMRGGTPPRILRELRVDLNKVTAEIAALRPEYAKAMRRAQATPREQGTIGLPGLQGTTFPDEIANAANIILRGEGQPTGLFSMPIRVANAFNNLYRGVRATLDNSALGIQGLLGAADDPVAYAKAVGVNIRAWGPGGDAALGLFIENFDTVTRTAGRLPSDDWARGGLRIGGAQTEFQLGAGFASAIAKAPGIRQANRAFGYFGDALRLEWADDMLEAELRGGKTLQQLWDTGDVQRIAEIANNMTGWAAGKAFGSMGDLLLFAPRFLQSRVETLVKAGMSLRPGATISQRAARRSLLKMMGYGAVLTVAANEMLGNDTDFRPLIWDAKRKQYTYNPNFMRIRFMGRDYSIYGTWDSLARAITVTAMGRPQEALRGLGSGIVADAWDIIGDRDFNGRPVRDTPRHFAEWLLRSNLPFSAEEVPAIVGGGVKAAREGEGLRAVGAGGVLALQTLGAKSSPMTRLETIGGATPEYNAYFDIPAGTNKRTKYREKHPEVDAKLFITGAVSSLTVPKSFTGMSSYASVYAALALIRENNINPDDIRAIKARKALVAASAKKGQKPPESKGVDRLIALLKTPAPPASAPSTAPSPQVVEPTSPFPSGWTEEQKRWWTEKGLPMNFPTPTPVGAR